MFKLLRRLRRDDQGATVIEYALLVSLVAVGLVATFNTFKTKIDTAFTNIGTNLTNTIK